MKKQSIIREKLHNAPPNRQHNSKKKQYTHIMIMGMRYGADARAQRL